MRYFSSAREIKGRRIEILVLRIMYDDVVCMYEAIVAKNKEKEKKTATISPLCMYCIVLLRLTETLDPVLCLSSWPCLSWPDLACPASLPVLSCLVSSSCASAALVLVWCWLVYWSSSGQETQENSNLEVESRTEEKANNLTIQYENSNTYNNSISLPSFLFFLSV